MRQTIGSVLVLAMFLTATAGVLAGRVQAEQAGCESVTVVILPPRERTAALLLICDRLAEELGKTKSIRVVNRTQLDRILKERKTAPRLAKPMLAYDLMVRMRLDSLRSAFAVELIDLSTGNVVAGRRYKWRAKPDKKQLADMVKWCRTAAGKVVRDESRPLRVRLLGVANVGNSPRIGPMATHLADIIEQAVSRSSKCVIVRHLEAVTSKEESLLIHMGLSRLAGGRRFLPQADVAIEAEIKETQTVGKTFKQTPLEVRFRLTRRGQKPSEWTTVSATVADWEKMVNRTCRGLAKKLGQTDPVPFGDYAAEMVRRRKQAEAELAAAERERQVAFDSPQRGWYDRILAAAKIDPTYEEAAYRAAACFQQPSKLRPFSEAWKVGMQGCVNYLNRFDWHRQHRTKILYEGLWMGFGGAFRDMKWRKVPSQLGPRREQLALFQTIVEMAVRNPEVKEHYGLLYASARIVYQAKAVAGVRLEDRRRWLQELAEQFQKRADSGRMELRAAQLFCAVEDSDLKHARSVITEILSSRPLLDDWNVKLCSRSRKQIVRMKDANLLSRYDEWYKSLPNGRKLGFLRIKWPNPRVYPLLCHEEERVKTWRLLYMGKRWQEAVSPLGLHDGRMYVVIRTLDYAPILASGKRGKYVSGKHFLGFLDVNQQGKPGGIIQPIPGSVGIRATCFAGMGKRVFFGTDNGLKQYSLEKKQWRDWGLKQGLPTMVIRSIYGLDEKTLLMSGGHLDGGGTFTLRPDTGEIKVVRGIRSGYLRRVWRNGDRLMAVSDKGIVTDILGKSHITRFDAAPYGWVGQINGGGIVDVTAIGSRRWLSRGDLHEIGNNGKIIRTWNQYGYFRRVRDGIYSDDVGVASTTPLAGRMCQDGKHLFFVSSSGKGVCYDPETDTWYGPLNITHEVNSVVSGRRGIWIGTPSGMLFMETHVFIAAAEKAGRVITSEQFKKRQDQIIRASAPLEQAKWGIMRHDFTKAVTALKAAFKKEPDNPKALLLIGFVHDACCLNKLDEAMKYYSHLAAIKDNPSARMTGLRAQFTVLLRQKKWKQAIEVGETFEKEFPRVIWDNAGRIKPRLQMARKQLAKDKK